MIVIVDYGYGNIYSITSAIKSVGFDCIVSSDSEVIEKAKILILPGVGAFNQAILSIRKLKLDKIIINAVKKNVGIIGICLGYQIFFEESQEFGSYEGLGLLKGKVVSLKLINPKFKRLPHIGWRPLIINKMNKYNKSNYSGKYVYFVHSFVPVSKSLEKVSTFVNFDGLNIHASIAYKNIIGFQFHPEKSGRFGLQILKNSINYLINI